MIGRGEDEIWPLVVEVFGAKIFRWGFDLLLYRRIDFEISRLRHWSLLLFYSFPSDHHGVPPTPLEQDRFYSMTYCFLLSVTYSKQRSYS
jgi:hypothetical protein